MISEENPLFPEIRIRQVGLPLEPKAQSSADHVLAVMDLHQEQVARGLGEGHRIIRGVAGSGKTLILAFRAEYLARASAKPVLILCFANGIAGRLEDVMQERGIEDRVQVRTFHSWCHQMLKTYGIPGPSQEQYPDYNERLAAIVRTAETRGCDLIVTGMARNETLGRFWLGRTVDRLLTTSPVPLLVVRQRVRRPYAHIVVATEMSDSSLHAL